MYYNLDWHITIGTYRLGMLDSVEIHKSVDLLAATCNIKLPGSVYNAALKIEDEDGKPRIKRGDVVQVRFGYDKALRTEFKGFLKTISTDDGSIVLECEDDLFKMRIAVADREFVNTSVKAIAQYLIDETQTRLTVNSTLTIDYDKFVIHNATAYDVLKKLKDETKGNIYLANGELHIHPPYIEQAGEVKYSFQRNIEKSDLKYRRAEDKPLEIVVENVGANGQKKVVQFGNTGGDKITISGNGLSEQSMNVLARNEFERLHFDGYEGSITGWLIPYCEPSYSAWIEDNDYEYKNGVYYVVSVNTSISKEGGVRKVTLGRRLL